MAVGGCCFSYVVGFAVVVVVAAADDSGVGVD